MEGIGGFVLGTIIFSAIISLFVPFIVWHYAIAFGEKIEMHYRRDYIHLLPVSVFIGMIACLCAYSEGAFVAFMVLACAAATGPFWMSHPATLIGVPIFLILGLIGAMCG